MNEEVSDECEKCARQRGTGKKIRLRRNELGFTIEEAAAKAGVGAKTWSRYETGCSIRQDKVAYICQTLHWKRLPGEEGQTGFDIGQYKSSPAWSQTLANTWGDAAAVSFVIGSDILLDYIRQDLEALSAMPKGSHIGELEISWLDMGLPQQFLMEYDYDFLYYLKMILLRLRMRVAQEEPITIRTVAEEVLLCLAVEESRFLMERVSCPRYRWKRKRSGTAGLLICATIWTSSHFCIPVLT